MLKYIGYGVAVGCAVLLSQHALELLNNASPSQTAVASPAQAQTNPTIAAVGGRTVAPGRCRARLTVNVSTSADVNDAGRVVISEWRLRAETLHGAEFANFKLADAPVVRCRKQGNDIVLNCFAEGSPCSR